MLAAAALGRTAMSNQNFIKPAFTNAGDSGPTVNNNFLRPGTNSGPTVDKNLLRPGVAGGSSRLATGPLNPNPPSPYKISSLKSQDTFTNFNSWNREATTDLDLGSAPPSGFAGLILGVEVLVAQILSLVTGRKFGRGIDAEAKKIALKKLLRVTIGLTILAVCVWRLGHYLFVADRIDLAIFTVFAFGVAIYVMKHF